MSSLRRSAAIAGLAISVAVVIGIGIPAVAFASPTPAATGTASVHGALTGADGPLDSADIVLTQTTTSASYSAAFDVSAQTWSASALPAGAYSVSAASGERWIRATWNLTLGDGTETEDGPRTLARSTDISGHVELEDGGTVTPWADGDVFAWPTNGASGISASVVDGAYDFYGVPPGSYRVCFADGGWTWIISTCWGGGTSTTSTVITIHHGQVISGIDGTVHAGGAVTGSVAVSDPSVEGHAVLRFSRWDPDQGIYVPERQDQTGVPWGPFEEDGLPAGDYLVELFDPDEVFNPQYWKTARYAYESTDVVVTRDHTTDLGTITLAPRTVDVARISGADRFATSVAVSKAAWATVPAAGVPVVYIADGLNFPDALAAGPAAAHRDGVVLLVAPGSIPAVVATELQRLRPQAIVIAGSTGAVSSAVANHLVEYAPSVTRAAGTDRFDTARRLVSGAFADEAPPFAIIATGVSFPDALTAGAAAGAFGAPVITVDGRAGSLDAATGSLLARLHVPEVYVVGGTASVSSGIQADLVRLLGSSHVARIAGADRFETAAAIDRTFFDGDDFAFVATGLNYPDALSGAPLAVAYGGPLILAMPQCIPFESVSTAIDLNAEELILLGGPASLGTGVERLSVC